MFILTLTFVLAYVIGAIPFSIYVSRLVAGIDIREHGSGNAGGTNVFRTLGWKYGALVIALDILKGVFVVLVVARLFQYTGVSFTNLSPFDDFTLVQIICGVLATIGHIWTVFADFRGGKGIATALGTLLAITAVDMLIALGVFILVVYIWRYVSLGSILAAITVPVVLFVRENFFNAEVQGYGTLLPFLIGMVSLLIYTHRKNIRRIIAGQENKISFAKKSSS